MEKCGHGNSTDSLRKMLILLFIIAKLIIWLILVHFILPAPAVNIAHEYDPITIIAFILLTIDGKTAQWMKLRKDTKPIFKLK